MPPLPTIKCAPIAALAEQLKFVPKAAARRHLLAAEELPTTIVPDQLYPEDWIAARITGFRPDLKSPAMIDGGALLADLSALIERLSVRAELRKDECAGWVSIPELTARWRVSRRTLERYRRQGLACRRVLLSNGGRVVVFNPHGVEAFALRFGTQLQRAAAFTRIALTDEERMLRRAARYRRVLGCSRFETASRLAARFSRSVEGCRRFLTRHDRSGDRAIFDEGVPLSRRARAVAERALRRGISPAAVARRFGKTPGAIRRAALLEQARWLRALDLGPAEGTESAPPTLAFAHPIATTGLDLWGAGSLTELAAAAMLARPLTAAVEATLVQAHSGLLRRARAAIDRLPAHGNPPGAVALDAITTDLRWAARLRARLVATQHLLMLKTIETQTRRGLLEHPPELGEDLFRECTAALVAAVEKHDHRKGGRLAAGAGLLLNRAVSRWIAARANAAVAAPSRTVAARAVPVLQPARIRDWTRTVATWQTVLEPDARLREALPLLAPAKASLLARHFGLSENPPASVATLASELGIEHRQASARIRFAVLEALRFARERATPGAKTHRRRSRKKRGS
ncbi:MAG: hypothetical protein ACT4PL_06380 [Phycisphaerales bacterium]